MDKPRSSESNQSFNVEIDKETLISDQKTAIMQEHKQNEFKTKRLNIFLATNTGTSIAPIENLKACYNPALEFD